MGRTIPLLLYAFMAWTGKTHLRIIGKRDRFLLIWNKKREKVFSIRYIRAEMDFLLPGMPNR